MSKLIEQLDNLGYVKSEEGILSNVYPTVAGIRSENKSITEGEAKAALRRAMS